MNSNFPMKKYLTIAGIIVAIIILAVIMAQTRGDAPAPQTASSTVPSVSTPTSSTGTPKPAAQTPTVKAPTAPVVSKPTGTYENYSDYLTELGAKQNACTDAASKQYRQLYSGLEQASYKDYFNTKTGVCFMKVTGTQRPAYGSPIAVQYFRNVSTGALIVDCSNSNNPLQASDWVCTNKVTGKSMTTAELDGLIYQSI